MAPYEPIKVEEEILAFWNTENTYQTIKNRNKSGKDFYFLDGPPYTSGKVHLGTAWNKSLKDMVLRYKRMRGLNVWDRAGYDMHGLPTEHATEKKLGLHGKEAIISYGVDKFVAECKKLCVDNLKVMNVDFQRLGVWMDFENAYQSITDDFIDGEWWLIKKAHEQKRLYRGLRTMTWCKDCATALAKHELEYKTVSDTSIFVKFKVKHSKTPGKNEYLIVWTTTPWTIPFNLAVMVNPELEYVKAEVDGEIWILSKALGNMVVQTVAGKKYNEISCFLGSELAGIEYEHFFDSEMNYKQIEAKSPEKMHTVLLSTEYVDTSAGTGLVHCAPGCGPEDFEVGHRNGLPAFNTIDEKGAFPDSAGTFEGLVAKRDDAAFVDYIAKKDCLIETTEVEHEYAHCWRCHNPVVFRTTKQWFFKVEDLKEKLIAENEKIKWVPETAYNAFKSWLTNLRDNSISKQRFWGTPIPIWVNTEDETDYIVVGNKHELETLSGKKVIDMHLPAIDSITIHKNGKTYQRVPDILDVWVDAGTVSWNCLYYPHRTDLFEKLFPAEFILEGKDQIRGWYNLLHIASMVSMGRPAFKNVYMHGFIQDSQGRKMSKSLGNYILPEEVISKYGADTFRYYMIGAANPGFDLNYNPDDLDLKFKNLQVLWNVHNYILDFYKNNDIAPTKSILHHTNTAEEYEAWYANLSEEDKYMISINHSAIQEATGALESYQLHKIPWIIERLYLELSRGYIQTIRERAVSGSVQDKEQIATIFAEVIGNVLTMLSIVAPFISEKMYQNLRPMLGFSQNSVHELSWPHYDAKRISKETEESMEDARMIIQSVLACRDKAQRGVRWPLAKIIIQPEIQETTTLTKHTTVLKSLILKQTNAKEIEIVDHVKGVTAAIQPNYGSLGKAFGKRTTAIAKVILELDPTAVTMLLQNIKAKNKHILLVEDIATDITIEHIEVTYHVPAHLLSAPFSKGTVYIDTTSSPALEAEGYAREITRRVQSARKTAGLERKNSITLYVQVSGEYSELIPQHASTIQAITGAQKIVISTNKPTEQYANTILEKIKNIECTIYFSVL